MRRVEAVSDSDPEADEADVLEDAIRDDLPVLRPEREAGSKRRGDEDDEDGSDAEIEECVLVLNASALVTVAHVGNLYSFAAGLVGPKVGLGGEKRGLRAEGWAIKYREKPGENPRSTEVICYGPIVTPE